MVLKKAPRWWVFKRKERGGEDGREGGEGEEEEEEEEESYITGEIGEGLVRSKPKI